MAAWLARPNSRLMVSSMTLALSALGFTLIGLLRQKLAITRYGTDVLTVLGQATIFQSMGAMIAGAGLILTARIIVSDPAIPKPERLSAGSFLIRRPALIGLILLPLLVIISPRVSSFYTGSESWSSAFALAGAGAIGQLILSNSLSLTQTLDGHRTFLRPTAFSIAGAAIITLLLMFSGNTILVFSTFILSPLTAFIALVCVSPSVRQVIRSAPSLSSSNGRRATKVVAASLIAGLTGLIVQSTLSAYLVRSQSLSNGALLQPLLLVSAGFALVTGSISSTVLVHRPAARPVFARIDTAWPVVVGLRVASGVALIAAATSPFIPVLLSVFYDSTLTSATLAVALQLAAEPLTAILWVGATLLLPDRRYLAWTLLSVAGPIAKATVALPLIPKWGAEAVALGSVAQALVGVAILLIVLRPRIRGYSSLAFACILAAAVSIPLTWLHYPHLSPWWALLSVTLAVIAVACLYRGYVSARTEIS